ncbi:MAG: hypothetical protein QOH35_5306 [Acidobacteriaceae bacterium]|nr:hypothetical protein [Acidobacteriaceae bacterium]
MPLNTKAPVSVVGEFARREDKCDFCRLIPTLYDAGSPKGNRQASPGITVLRTHLRAYACRWLHTWIA